MAISNFLSAIWSENLLTKLDQQYVAVANCNRDYDGEIKGQGSTVKICGVGNITVKNYTKNSDIDTETLSDTYVNLNIDQAKYFNFQIDDIDRAQSTPKLMDAAIKLAANRLSEYADRHVYSLYNKAASKISVSEPTADSILDAVISARQKLTEKGVTNFDDVVLEVTPYVASLLFKAKVDFVSNNDDLVETGCLGRLFGCKVFVTKNITEIPDEGCTFYKCFMRTKRAIAFAEQVSEIVAYRPEKRFSDAVKGLHLYGTQVIYPDELVVIDVCV